MKECCEFYINKVRRVYEESNGGNIPHTEEKFRFCPMCGKEFERYSGEQIIKALEVLTKNARIENNLIFDAYVIAKYHLLTLKGEAN